MAINKKPFGYYVNQRTAPSIIGMAGSAVWKLIDAVGNVDFLLSLENRTTADLFQFILSYGWFMLLLVCVVWFLTELNGRGSVSTSTSILVSCLMTAVVFFGLGALFTVKKVGITVDLLRGWGGPPNECRATVASARLTQYKKSHRLVILCGPGDQSRDYMTDTRFVMSNPFIISGGDMQINAAVSEAKLIQWAGSKGRWTLIGLIPEGVAIDKFATVKDIEDLGGLVLRPKQNDYGSQ